MNKEERREYMRLYNLAYRGKHREQQRKYSADWKRKNRKRHAELNLASYYRNQEAIKERRKRQYRENHEEALQKVREGRAKRRDKHNAYQRQYQKQNPLYVIKSSQARRARVRNAQVEVITEKAIAELYRLHPCCAYCGKRMNKRNRSLDHITPLSRGGMHALSNLIPACRPCNTKKGSKLLAIKTAMPQKENGRK